jgi:hypothetical protein
MKVLVTGIAVGPFGQDVLIFGSCCREVAGLDVQVGQ